MVVGVTRDGVDNRPEALGGGAAAHLSLLLGSADNFLAIVDEIDSADGWMVVAVALNADVASLTHEVHGLQTQQWLDQKIAQLLNRNDDRPDDTR